MIVQFTPAARRQFLAAVRYIIAENPGGAVRFRERTERVLKTLWRERHQTKAGWTEQYRILEARSEQVRRTALTILESQLK